MGIVHNGECLLMKIFKSFIFVCLSLSAFDANADETNQYTTSVYGAYPAKPFHSEKGDGSEKQKESLSAEYFSEGNWGQPCEGFQLSLRFDKQIYKEDEPITAIILARNVTNYEIGFTELIRTGGNGPVGFIITNANSQRLVSDWDKTPPSPGHVFFAGHMINIEPKTQWKFYERLDKIYQLERSTYSVQAAIKIPTVNPPGGFMEIRSSEVPIKIK